MGKLRMNLKETNKILLIAHRGASNIAPENTIKAFQMAIELNADGIEFDVRQSEDGELVIIHDSSTLRTTHSLGFINKMNIEKIKLLNAGKGEQIPTLRELINCTKGKINLMCELKVHGISEKVVDILKDADLIDSTIVISFKHDELLKIKKIEPKLRVGSIIPSGRGWISNWFAKKKEVLFASTNEFFSINPFYLLVNQKFVDFAHHHGLKLFSWTVNSKRTIKKLIKMGVDGILTNNIKKVNEIQKKYFS
jgi:glycerophosphoryl diester phosphodiesterase